MNPRGIYKRGNIWWYTTGRKVRRSSGSSDINEALAQRAHAVALRRHRACSDEWRKWVAEQRADSNSWLRRTFNRMRRKSRLRTWGDCLALEDFVRIVLASDGKCAITGIEFSRTELKRDPFAISVDRINSARGYCAGNVRVVLLAVNLAMSQWGEASLIRIAAALAGRELLKSVHGGGYGAFRESALSLEAKSPESAIESGS